MKKLFFVERTYRMFIMANDYTDAMVRCPDTDMGKEERVWEVNEFEVLGTGKDLATVGDVIELKEKT